MRMLLRNLNPERNPRTRAILYVIGAGGFLHLTTLLVIAIVRHKKEYFNPFYTVDIDQLWSGAHDSNVWYVIGWLAFFILIYGVYRLISRGDSSGDVEDKS